MPNKFASTISVYNKYASQFVQHFENKLETKELDEFIALLPKNGKVLDAGCGSARDSAYMISKGYSAQGIDLSEGLLAEAKKIHPEVPTQLMSLTEISFPATYFDGIWCKAALLHLDRKEIPRVLKDFRKILKPNGILFIQTKLGQGEGTQAVPFNHKLTRMFTFFTIDELSDLVTSAGFELTKSYAFNGRSRSAQMQDQDWVVVFARKNK